MVRTIKKVWCVTNPEILYEVGKDGVNEIQYAASSYQVIYDDGMALVLPFIFFAAWLSKQFEDPDVLTFDEKLSKAMLEMMPEDEEVTA